MEQVVIDSSSIQIIELLGAGGYGEIFEAIVNGNKGFLELINNYISLKFYFQRWRKTWGLLFK